jgi:hypothetical protein
VLVVIEVACQIVLAVTARFEPKDERDLVIESKAYRNAYLLLAGATFWLMWTIVAQQMRSYMAVNLMLLSVVAAEITKSLTQLFLYWRGL